MSGIGSSLVSPPRYRNMPARPRSEGKRTKIIDNISGELAVLVCYIQAHDLSPQRSVEDGCPPLSRFQDVAFIVVLLDRRRPFAI